MPFHAPYHSKMEKEVEKAASIINSFFDSSLSADKSVPAEFIQNCSGLAFLTVVKAGFIWSGKLGTGVVISRLEDGSWSAPSGIGTAGVGFGAEVGGEIIDFMLILGNEAAVKTFKKGTQITVGAGLDLAIGPYGRAAAANVSAGGSGLSANYTYSHAKGAFIGVGLHGSTILVRGDMNSKYYGREVSPMEILSGGVTAPSTCNVLYEAIARAERGGSTWVENQNIPRPHSESLPPPPSSSFSSAHQYGNSGPRHSVSSSSSSNDGNSLSQRNSIGSVSIPVVESSIDKSNDPRLRRYSNYKSERELYASFAANNSSNVSDSKPSSLNKKSTIPSMPTPASSPEETRQLFHQVIEYVSSQLPNADVQIFKTNCRQYGQDKMTLTGYMYYLKSIGKKEQLKDLIPQLIRLLPTEEKRAEVWNAYLKDVLEVI